VREHVISLARSLAEQAKAVEDFAKAPEVSDEMVEKFTEGQILLAEVRLMRMRQHIGVEPEETVPTPRTPSRLLNTVPRGVHTLGDRTPQDAA
jgi:hypothetical protein